MWYHSVLDYLKPGPARTGNGRGRRVAPRKKPATCQLHLEPLEDRSLPSSSPVLNFAAGLDGPPALARDHHHDSGLIGSWTPAASMSEARAFYTETLLEDGRVLVAGAFVQTNGIGPPDGGAYSDTAEIYDPRVDTWSPTGDLTTARAGQAAVRLQDGRVLVAGGQNVVAPGSPPVTLSSAEIYDPATGQWAATGSMNVPRTEATLTLLPDGRVFVSGATRSVTPTGQPGPDAKSAEIYDPATGQWTRVADMSTPRSDHVQTLLDDGRILVAGGLAGSIANPIAYTSSAEIYDPVSNIWTPTGNMTMPRVDTGFINLKDGRVLVTGGNTAISTPTTRTNTAEIYDPATGQWSLTGGALSDPKVDPAITLLKDGRVLVAGGFRTSDTPVASADLYDPKADTWTPLPSMSEARGGISAVTLKNGRVLVVGGLNFAPDKFPEDALPSAEIFEPPGHHGHGHHDHGHHGHHRHGHGHHGNE